MGLFKKLILGLLIISCFTFCASNNQKQMEFPQEISKVYFETATIGSRPKEIDVYFYIEFKEQLEEDIELHKVYFRNQETVIEKVSSKKYVGHFPKMAIIEDMILDSDSEKEFGNKAPIVVKPKFDLKKNEALLEYTHNKESSFTKLTGIQER